MAQSGSSALASGRRIDQSGPAFNTRTRSLSRQSIRSISGEFEPTDIVEETGNDTIVPSKKGKEAETRDASVREIDIGGNANYQEMTEKDPSKIAKTIRVENQKELRKILLRKDGATWYEVLASTFQQQDMLSEKYLDLKRKEKNNKSMQKEWARLMTNWDTEKLDLEEEIAVEKLKTQRVKAENSDLTREISDLRRQIRGSMATPSISVASAPPAAPAAPAIAEPVVTVTANYRPRGNNPKEPLDGKNLDAYSPWAFTIEGKISTDAPLYPNEQEKMKYALSQMTNPIFDALYTWVIDVGPSLSLEAFFKKIQSYLGIAYLAKNAKKELREISMNKNETVTEYYHRLFKLWQRAKTPAEDRIETFKDILKPSVAVPLLSRDFDSLETLLHEARKIEQGRKELNQKFAKQDSQKSAKPTSSIPSTSRGFNKTTITTSSTSIAVKPKTTTPSAAPAVNKNSNSNFGPVSVKPTGWIGAWHDGTLHPPKLNDAEREKLSREGRCWSCRGSGHRGRDSCCIRQKANLSRVVVVDDSSESSDSKKE